MKLYTSVYNFIHVYTTLYMCIQLIQVYTTLYMCMLCMYAVTLVVFWMWKQVFHIYIHTYISTRVGLSLGLQNPMTNWVWMVTQYQWAQLRDQHYYGLQQLETRGTGNTLRTTKCHSWTWQWGHLATGLQNHNSIYSNWHQGMQLNTGLTTTSHTLHCIQVDTPRST